MTPVSCSTVIDRICGEHNTQNTKKNNLLKNISTQNDSTLLQKCLRFETSLLQNTPLSLMGTASILTVRDFKKDFSGRFFAENRNSTAYKTNFCVKRPKLFVKKGSKWVNLQLVKIW